jgi:UDP-N-acetylmuramyl-tripeptide synthetase
LFVQIFFVSYNRQEYSERTLEITIKEVAARLNAEVSGPLSAIVTDVTHDSRQARPGTLFAAIKGLTTDGHQFVGDVLRRGAVGVISDHEPPKEFQDAWLRVVNAREALANASSVINGDPSHKLDLIGVTGTNGKTTTTYLCFALAKAAGVKPAMLTTVEYRIGKESEAAVRTTPEASDTNRFLRNAVNAGCGMAAMEASSQAIDLHRCDWLRFRVAVFTNLSQDHLDYHNSMEEYFDAKKKLFDGRVGERPASCVVNIDDVWGKRLLTELNTTGQRSATTSQKDASANYYASNVSVSLISGTSFTLTTPQGQRSVNSPLVGRPHVYNMLSAAAAASELGYDLDSIVAGLNICVGAPGRFERVPHAGDFAVVVDYAHTDDALFNTLRTARELTKGRIITVFGCGGDRDKTKREPMGRVAGENSGLVFVTSDNPRTEDPMTIIRQVEVGVKTSGTPYSLISDRRDAIKQAVAAARRDDVVIIAGKGHETYQIVGHEKFHFDDREVALEAMSSTEI